MGEHTGAKGGTVRDRICDEQLAQALGKTGLTDVRFQVKGLWKVSGHRSVLSARSEVFASMFTNETTERETGTVDLNDVTVEGLRLFLEFVYIGMSHRL